MVIIRTWNQGRIIAGKEPFPKATGIALEVGYQHGIFLSGIRFLYPGQQTLHRKAYGLTALVLHDHFRCKQPCGFLNRNLPTLYRVVLCTEFGEFAEQKENLF
ncbi:hypothetical protein D3C75_953680 [compost metagenome]